MPQLFRIIPLLTALLLGACASSPLPKVRVAEAQHAAGGTTVESHEAAAALQNAQRILQANGRMADYNAAVEHFLMQLQQRLSPHDWKSPLRLSGAGGSWTVRFHQGDFARQGKPEYSPSFFDALIPAGRVDLSAYPQIVRGEGLGAPLVLALEDGEAVRKQRAFRPRNGMYAAATAVVEFGKPAADGATPATLRLINPRKQSSATAAGGRQTLAYNLTAMVEMNLDNPYIRQRGIPGLLKPEAHFKDLGLFGMEVHDSAKIPVVFVHGLGSDPGIWKIAVNAIYADPKLSARYMPLLYVYPTGMSVPGAAAKLRQRLNEYRAARDPQGRSAAMNRMVIVGHSMGGLLTRLQLIESGERLREAFFTRPIDDIAWLPAEQRKTMQDGLILHPQPFVDRAVFIATPHRGSKVADRGLVRWAVRLIKLPYTAASIAASAMTFGYGGINPELERFNSLGLRSVDMLSPEHPYFAALDKCPIAVPFHSIIGDRGRGLGPKSSDGLVPYWSAHLDGAVSEKIVPHSHNCTEEPDTVAEICRILHFHLGENGPPRKR